jgi:hypothetical protein
MKFTCSTIINLPKEKVAELYSNENNLKYWQSGFQSKELLSGTKGQPGAKSKISMTYNNKPMVLTETIQKNNLPDEVAGYYEHKHMNNTMTCRFQQLDSAKTRFDMEIHYTKFFGFMPKLMSVLVPGMFKKQAQKMVDSFKTFAENKK